MGQLLSVSTSKKATLTYNFAADLPSVMADATQIRQVVMNLITNASEAIGDSERHHHAANRRARGATATISPTRSATANDRSPGDTCSSRCRTRGCGMDAETLGRIFDPFFSTKFAGRGLGLAAVLGIVRGHKGAVKVSLAPGKGTTFRVLLPAHGAAAAPGEATPAARGRLPWPRSGAGRR